MRGQRITLIHAGVLTGVLLIAAAIFSRGTHAATPLTPNLQALKASSLRLESPGGGLTYLRFSATSANVGDGPLEIVGGAVDPSDTSKQLVDQRIYNSDGTYSDSDAGSVDYHPDHGHMHFNDYALYTLDAVGSPGASLRTSQKTTFCIIDTTRVKRFKDSPRQPVYTSCGSQVQGLSKGWGDTYPYYLPGQAIDVTGLPDGDYALTIEVDPKDQLIESNDTDNTSVVKLRLQNGTVTVLKGAH